MTEAILKAEKLKRVFTSGKSSFAAVDQMSFDLKKGECRPLTEEEIRKLKEAGRASGKNPKKC